MRLRFTILLGLVGIALLSLNLRRDLRRLSADYTWERVTRTTLHRTVSAPGTMEAVRVATVRSQVDETVLKKLAQEGQAVKEGQILLELSQTKTELEFEQRRNALRTAQVDYQKSVRDLAIQKKLLRNLAASRSQVEDAARAVDQKKADLQVVAHEFDLAEKRLDSTHVRAPISGVVLSDPTTIGAMIASGNELITVGDISRFIVRTKVDELDIGQVRVGQQAEVRADADPTRIMTAVVRSIASQAEREAFAKVQVLLDITDAAGVSLKHNLSVRVSILIEDLPRALGIPVKSILRKDGDRGWVYARDRWGFIFRRKVRLGRMAGEQIEVLDGLSGGEEVGTEAAGEAP